MIRFNPNKYSDNKDNEILNKSLKKVSKKVDSLDKYMIDKAIDQYEPKKYMDFLYHKLNYEISQEKDKDLVKILEDLLMLSRNKITLNNIYKKNMDISINKVNPSKSKLFNMRENNIPFSDLKVKEEVKPKSDINFIKQIREQLDKTDQGLLSGGKNLKEKFPKLYEELIEYANSNLNIEN